MPTIPPITPIDFAALAREIAAWIDSDAVDGDDARRTVADRLETDLAQSHAAGLDQGRIEGALAERENAEIWPQKERDYQRMLAEFEARADGAEAMAKMSHAAGRAEGLGKAAKDIDELLSDVDPLTFNDLAVRAAWQDRAWAVLKKWRALASSDPAPRDQVPRPVEEWHSTEEDGGPDVGVNFVIDEKRSVWCGEISKSRFVEADMIDCGGDAGWFVILYDGAETTVLAKAADQVRGNRLARLAAIAMMESAHPVEPGEVERLAAEFDRDGCNTWSGATIAALIRKALATPRPTQPKGPTK